MACSLVAIHERMILNQGKSERGRFLGSRGVELFAPKFHLRLADRRNESASVPKFFASSGLMEEALVRVKYFGDAQVSHGARRLKRDW